MSSGISVPPESQKKYLVRRQEEVAQMKASMRSSPDWDLLKKVGHQMKGNASTFGFPELTALAKDLESAAMRQDSDAAGDILRLMELKINSQVKAL